MRLCFLMLVASLGAARWTDGAAATPDPDPPAAARLQRCLERVLAAPEGSAPQTEPTGDVTVAFSPSGRILAVLEGARRAEQQRDWERAAELYQRLLDDAPAELCQPGPRLYLPMRIHVEERLASFPPEGLAAYRRQVDRRAQDLFDAAARSADPADMEPVARRFLLSSSGDDALNRLATAWLARGQHGRALRAWRRLLRLCPGTTVGLGSVAAKLTVCLHQLGRAAAAREFSALVQKTLGGAAETLVAGRRVSIGDLAAHLPEAAESPTDASWPMPGGSPSHARTAAAALRPGRLAWSDMIHSRAAKQAVVDWRARHPFGEQTAEGEPSVRALPIVAGNAVVYPARTGVLARQADTGKLLWEWPWPRTDRALRALGPFSVPSRHVGHWSCSASRTAVFCSIPYQKETARGQLGMGGSLAAIDRETGLSRWQISAADVLPPDIAEGGTFVSPPAPCEGRLVVGLRAGAAGDEYHLCGLRARDGAPLWRTFIASRPSDPLYRLSRYQPWFEGMPALEQGLAVVAAGGGVVAAVEAATGELAWLARYDQAPGQGRGYRWYRYDRWRTWTPIAADGVVYATPPDSDYLYAFELDSGGLLWRHPRGAHRYLAGVRDGRAYLLGTSAACLDARGQVLWQTPLPSVAAAQPCLAGRVLHVPLAGGLLFLDAATGDELAWSSWDDWKTGHGPTWTAHIGSGDLVAAAERLFVATAFTLNVFEPLERMESIEQHLDGAPNDAEAQCALGQEKQWAGDAAGAAEAFEKALELAANRPGALAAGAAVDARRRLATCYHDVARSHQEAGRPELALAACQAALRHAPRGTQRTALLFRAAALADRLQRWPDAVASYQSILSAAASDAPPWAEARDALDDLLRRAGRQPYAACEAAAQRALAKGAHTDLLSVVEHYPNSQTAPVAMARLAGLAAAPSEGALWLYRLVRDYPASPQAPPALYRLAARYATEGAEAMARGALSRLRCRYPQWRPMIDLSPDALIARLAQHRLLEDKPPPDPPLAPAWTMLPDYGAPDLRLTGSSPAADGAFFVVTGQSFECRAPADGSLRWADRPGWIGIRITDALRRGGGVRISSTVRADPPAPAELAGLRAGDTIVAFGDQPLRDTQELITACMSRRAGTAVRVRFLRDGEPRTVEMQLGERPSLGTLIDHPPPRFAGVADGKVLVRKATRAEAVDLRTGTLAWSLAIDRPAAAGESPRDDLAAAAPGVFVVADGRSRLAALDAHTGRSLWSIAVEEPTVHRMAIGPHGLVVASSRPASLRLINPFDGTVAHRIVEPHALGAPLFTLDTQGRLCYAIGCTLGCYDLRTRRLVWSIRVADFTARHVGVAAPLLVAHGQDERGLEVLECRDLATGAPVWARAMERGERAQMLDLSARALYAVSRRAARAAVRRFDTSTGEVTWTHALPRTETLAACETTAGSVLLGLTVAQADGGRRAEVVALDKATGEETHRLAVGVGTLHELRRIGRALYAVVEESPQPPARRRWVEFDIAGEPARFRMVRLVPQQ